MADLLAFPFMQRALAAGVLVGLATSLLGVLVVLRRSAFFGDAIGHASLAGVALGVVSGLPPLVLAAAVSVGIGLSLHEADRRSQLGLDTLLGIALPLFMSIGVLILSVVPGYQPELFSFLFGSILAVGPESLAGTGVITLLVVTLLVLFWRPMVFVTFDVDGARVSGIPTGRLLAVFHVLLALVVVASIKTVGVVLVNALLVIPAATAKLLAPSLRAMFVLSPLIGVGCVIGGLVLSYVADLPSGPAIVVTAGAVFVLVWLTARRRG